MLSEEILDVTGGGGGGLVQTLETTPFEYEIDAPVLVGSIINADAVNLSWNAVQNAAGYKIRRDGYVMDVGNRLSYPIGSLPLETTFRFDVMAYAAGGKESAWSNAVIINPTLGTISGAGGQQILSNAKPRTRIIIRAGQPSSGLPLPSGTSSGATGGGSTTGTNQPATAADDLLFGYDKTTVLIVGGVAVGGLALYMFSGKK